MKYPEGLSPVELVQCNYRNVEILDEFARRDELNRSVRDERVEEPDNQMVFDFHKGVASANNESVKDCQKV